MDLTEIERRRQLSRLTKRELIDWVLQIETAHGITGDAITALRERVETAGDEQ